MRIRIFQNYRCIHAHGDVTDYGFLKNFRMTFPEIDGIRHEELANRFEQLGMDFYIQEEQPVEWWMRLTAPFAIILHVLLLLFTPIKWMLTGESAYSGLKGVRRWFGKLWRSY